MIDYEGILKLCFTIIALIFTVVTHEVAHGYVAYLNGDNTAKLAGRLSLNPLVHLDITGLIFLLVFKFGWAKPVPINQWNFKDRKKGLFLVSIAGVSVNILTAIVSILVLYIFNEKLGIFSHLFLDLALYGIVFFVFNLIPIPPLDGSKVIASFLSDKFQYFIYKYERYFYILLIAFLYFNRQSGVVSNLVYRIFDLLVALIGNFFG